MARAFTIPAEYRAPLVTSIKKSRDEASARKKEFSPSEIITKNLTFKLARHFGFCYGVENAIETAYRAISENPQRRVFLLSEMIHNTRVNGDLEARGVKFLMDTAGNRKIPFNLLTPEDIVIVPAFGTTRELFKEIEALGINPLSYNATCPFVEKVWRRASQLGEAGYSIVIHGKYSHEETRATFSHAVATAPSVVILDMNEARVLAEFITGVRAPDTFKDVFRNKHSDGFDPRLHLTRIGVVNQTTMLASETQEISAYLKEVVTRHYPSDTATDHFADTRDTLCYATLENQQSVHGLLASGGDLSLVIGGYNSSNTSHLVEICEKSLPTFYIKDEKEIESLSRIHSFSLSTRAVTITDDWFPRKRPVTVLVTAGASCPDRIIEDVIRKVASLCGEELNEYEKAI